ncbi:MAG: AAA family ATPase, partial [Kiritimatiellae bacterium]|nr:AAA family ATPase [Kiritimatiellia bacterium]
MKPIATSTSDFADLIKSGAIYVDKTAYFHRLVSNRTNNLLFLSRPRRFGKSLTITALKEIFSGNRELFEGLAISKTDWSWEKWPVIYFNFGDALTTDFESFLASATPRIKQRLEEAGFDDYNDSIPPSVNFGNAIDSLSKKNGNRGVVILIDEYDAPISHSLSDLEKAEAIRDWMGSFYQVMKDRTGAIRFLLMTGVSKFTKMSVFSCLNNIVDISTRQEYATMLGYTEEELEEDFEEHLREHAKVMEKSYEDYRAEMKLWYNGFRFSHINPATVYNPISVALTLDAKEPDFRAIWSSTGRASSLMNSLKRWDMLAIDPDKTQFVTEQELDVTNLADLKPIGMLYQTGYLTIKDYADGLYTLSVPDEEVRRDLNLLMTSVAAEKDVSWAASLGAKLRGGAFADF